jgi:hypothetical protein
VELLLLLQLSVEMDHVAFIPGIVQLLLQRFRQAVSQAAGVCEHESILIILSEVRDDVLQRRRVVVPNVIYDFDGVLPKLLGRRPQSILWGKYDTG